MLFIIGIAGISICFLIICVIFIRIKRNKKTAKPEEDQMTNNNVLFGMRTVQSNSAHDINQISHNMQSSEGNQIELTTTNTQMQRGYNNNMQQQMQQQIASSYSNNN